MKEVKFAILGCGQRGYFTCHVFAKVPGVKVTAVCDPYEDKAHTVADKINETVGYKPEVFTDSSLAMDSGVDAVFITASWEPHISLAIEAMKKGIIVLCEVGGAYSVADCWRLVDTYEATKTPIMFMENCCYDKEELLVTSLVRNGLFGEIVHCEGAYGHDLREEVCDGENLRHYRLRNYLNRNCDNYPTHDLGPIAKLLDINRGNRMVSLVSMASKAAGLEDYINRKGERFEHLKGKHFKQGDITSTIIKCANGETILLHLDTTLPHYYDRHFTVRGTRGFYEQNLNLVYVDEKCEEITGAKKFCRENFDNAEKYEEKYLCEEWRNITEEDINSGHGGMDPIIFRKAVECILEGKEFPIDVYDMASWMVITALSEISIAQGGTVQEIPDFTNGKWMIRERKDVVDFPIYNE